MKKNMNTKRAARLITVVMIIVALFAATAQASEKTVGTNDIKKEFRAEALQEKAEAVKTVETVEANEAVVTFEANEVEEVVEVKEVVTVVETVEVPSKEEIEVAEVKEEIVENEVETAEEFVEADEMEMEAMIASTADAANASNEVKTIDAATASDSADGVVVQFTNFAAANTTNTANANTTNTAVNASKNTLKDVNAKYLGTTSGTKKAITLVGDSTFRDVTKLQAAIDANNIVCYPTADMTKGVKYIAGHNPGAMSHVAGLKVGSIVRLSNDEGYQDYQIKEIKQGSGSFSSITFNTTNGVMDAWSMIKKATENAVIIQYCVNGVNTLHYGVAL